MFRDLFNLPEGVYLLGHSLGPPLKRGAELLEERLNEWAALGATAWFAGGWIERCDRLRAKMAPLVGALPTEVALQLSLTANLHQMLHAFYRPEGERQLIAIDGPAFPSDRYAIESALQGSDRLRIASSVEELEELAADPRVALLLVSGVNFYTGELFDLERLAAIAHQSGALIGGILAHAVGNVPLKLHSWGVDFAVWCTYKYLCGGPGSPGGLFVHQRHWGLPHLAGWWGEEQRFAMEQRSPYRPRFGAAGWELSTPSPLALAPLEAALDLFNQVGMEQLRERSLQLTDQLEELLLTHLGVRALSPQGRRGAMLSLQMEAASADRLCQKGLFCDGRPPGVVRMTPAPHFIDEEDLFRLCKLIQS